MSGARDAILGEIRTSLGRGTPATAPVHPPAAPVPARGQLGAAARVNLFQDLAESVSATVAHISDTAALPAAIADYLAGQNLPASALATNDAFFDDVPWDRRPTLEIKRGAPDKDDDVVVTRAKSAVAETGSLVMAGDRANPHLANFLPETSIVVLHADRIVGTFEELWPDAQGPADLPRTLTFVTGPSRTGDIGLKIELGAHGPRRVHIVIMEADGQGPTQTG